MQTEAHSLPTKATCLSSRAIKQGKVHEGFFLKSKISSSHEYKSYIQALQLRTK